MNKVILTGRLANDDFFEKEWTNKNNELQKLLKFTIATKEWNDKNEFIEIVAFNKVAESLKEGVKVGDLIELEGRLKTNNFTSKEGEAISKIDVIAYSVTFVAKSQENINKTKFENIKKIKQDPINTDELDELIASEKLQQGN